MMVNFLTAHFTTHVAVRKQTLHSKNVPNLTSWMSLLFFFQRTYCKRRSNLTTTSKGNYNRCS